MTTVGVKGLIVPFQTVNKSVTRSPAIADLPTRSFHKCCMVYLRTVWPLFVISS